jgi:tetratricopeptide (TPR) repeat protein
LLSPEQIAARLDDRFRLLVGGSRTALPRQQTLRALIDWSYDLLSDEEKRLLQFASVFVGGWTLDALEAVADDANAIEHLEGLVNKSLVVTEERGSEMRYSMLETIRQYAREKLFDAKQASAARDRHFAYFNELAEWMYDGFYSRNLGNDPAKRSRAEDEIENLRAALEWGLENHTEDAIRLAGNFCMISGWIGNLQTGALELGKIAIDRFKALPPVDGNASIQRQKLLAKALFAQGNLGMGRGNNRVVIQDFQEAIANARAAGDKRILGYSLGMFFTAAMFVNTPGAAEAAEEGFRIFRDELDDIFGLVMAYQNMARIATGKGNHDEKDKYIAKAKDLLKEMPMSFQSGLFFFSMGMNERIQNNYESAKTYFKDGLDIFKNIRNKNFELAVTSELGHVARHTGDIIEARRIYKETLEGWQNLGNRGAVANQLECFGFLAITDEEPQHAAKLFGAAEVLREKAQSPMTDFELMEYDQSVAQLRAMLPAAEFNALWAEGRSMTMEQAIQLALT